MSITNQECAVIESILGPDPEQRQRQHIEQRIAARLVKVATLVAELSDPEATRHRSESYSYARLITRLNELGDIGEELQGLQDQRRELNR